MATSFHASAYRIERKSTKTAVVKSSHSIIMHLFQNMVPLTSQWDTWSNPADLGSLSAWLREFSRGHGQKGVRAKHPGRLAAWDYAKDGNPHPKLVKTVPLP